MDTNLYLVHQYIASWDCRTGLTTGVNLNFWWSYSQPESATAVWTVSMLALRFTFFVLGPTCFSLRTENFLFTEPDTVLWYWTNVCQPV